jgi:hypothetical protein
MYQCDRCLCEYDKPLIRRRVKSCGFRAVCEDCARELRRSRKRGSANETFKEVRSNIFV